MDEYSLHDEGGAEVNYPGYKRASPDATGVINWPACLESSVRYPAILAGYRRNPGGEIAWVKLKITVSAGITPQLDLTKEPHGR